MPSILIVEDSDYSRALLRQQLSKLGLTVTEACDGKEAWEIVQKEPINLVITDWEMPELDGVELCRLIRSAQLPRYVYIILLTVKAERSDMVTGIEAGADNFLVKPVTTAQLRVMLHTAQRVLNYERKLLDRNRRLAKVSNELKRGMRAAANFHKTLLPQSQALIHGIKYQALSRPCDYTTGDMFNVFAIDADHIVFYLLDVAGHGIPAAMMSFTLSHFLSVGPMDMNQVGDDTGFLNFFSPAEVTAKLNRRFQARTDDWLSFTMIYGVIDQRQKRVTFTQAGHPPLLYQKRYKPSITVGDGGYPVGFFEEVTFEEYQFSYQEGDRLLLYSDGITECPNADKLPYGANRLIESFDRARSLPLERTLSVAMGDLVKWRGSEDFEDDVSLLAIEFGKPEQP